MVYKHTTPGKDNGDSHLKALLIHHEVIVPITAGQTGFRHVAAHFLRGVRWATDKE